MSTYLQSLILIILEVSCCRIFFDTFETKKTPNPIWKSNGLFLLLTGCFFLSAILFGNFFVLKQGIIISIITILMKFYFKMGVLKAFTLTVLFQGLLLAVDYFVYLLHASVFQSISETTELYPVQEALLIILGKVILLLVVLIIKRYIGKDTMTKLMDTEWLRLIFFPIFTICTVTAMIITADNMQSPKQENTYIVIAIGMAVMNIAVFYLIKDILKRELEVQESRMSQMQVKNQISLYHSISDNYERQRKKTHEYRNQIMCIEALMKNKNYNELEEYLQNISGKLNESFDMIHTNNVIIDAILNAKYQEMINNNIVFVFRINDLSNIHIEEEDTVILLSNLLNNALEACKNCKNKKIIKAKFIREEGMLILSVKNTYEHKLLLRDGQFQTSKAEDIDEHGIGMKNIIDIIQKYGGSYTIQENGFEFYFSIIIPCNR